MKLLNRFLHLFRRRSDLYLFGSSILWGQGHLTADKIGAKTAGWIARNLKENVTIHVHAHSGAFLTGDPSPSPRALHGEVPTPWPSVMTQIDGSKPPRSGKVRILVEGGINEVGGLRIASPTTSKAYIAAATKSSCYLNFRLVLDRISKKFPSSDIYVIGYFQILADRAESAEVGTMMESEGLPPVGEDENFEFARRAVDNTRIFHALSDKWLLKSVEEMRPKHSGTCEFIGSGFTGCDGMFGERPLLFHPFERDGMMGIRARQCTSGLRKRRTGLHCYLAATAHPNTAGIERYVSQITSAVHKQESGTRTSDDRSLAGI